MFVFAGQEASSASVTSTLLTRLLPHLSRTEIRQWVLTLRKTGHFFAYALLTILVYYAARKTKKLDRWALPFAVVFAFAVAMADENYQSRLPYRTGTWQDVLIDGLGIGLAVVGIWLSTKMRKESKGVTKEDDKDER